MTKMTVSVIEDLLNEDLDHADIAKIMSDTCISQNLENGAPFEIADSVEEFGENNSDNELYEDDDFESFGNFLLSVPGAWKNIKLPSGKVFSLMGVK